MNGVGLRHHDDGVGDREVPEIGQGDINDFSAQRTIDLQRVGGGLAMLLRDGGKFGEIRDIADP